MVRLSLIFLIIFAFHSSIPASIPDETSNLQPLQQQLEEHKAENYNVLLDLVLVSVRKLIKKKYDPVKIPDVDKRFSKKILFVTFKAGALLRNGVLSGISSLNRSGDCTIMRTPDNITLDLDMEAKNVHASFTGKVYSFSESFGLSIDVEAKIRHIRIRAVIFQGNKFSDKAVLRNFIIKKVDYDVKIVGGISIFKWIINPLISAVKYIFKSRFNSLIESKVKSAMADTLSKIHLPLS